MATLRQDPRTGNWQIRFYWNGSQHERSCRTKKHPTAQRILVKVEETMELVNTGRITVPKKVDPVAWLLSGGQATFNTFANGPSKEELFGQVCDAYTRDQNHKQDTTLESEATHIQHLKRHLKTSTPIRLIDLAALRQYRRRRSGTQYHGKPISDVTIRKELVTFRQIWMWAKQNEYVTGLCPLLDERGRWKLEFEKPDTQEKFMTWDQIVRKIDRGSSSEPQISELWKGLFLDTTQITQLLSHVDDHAKYKFIFPMFAFAAYTGARKSEILRSEIDDFDFQTGQVTIRERKRRKDRKGSRRLVPLHPKLRSTMEAWFAQHPGGSYTIAPPSQMPWQKSTIPSLDHLTPSQAHHHFSYTLSKSKWQVISGFHVLRHSFGSNLVRSGKVSSDVVAKWMGHTTMEMCELYQHLFPQDGLQQIMALE
jgi:integrase